MQASDYSDSAVIYIFKIIHNIWLKFVKDIISCNKLFSTGFITLISWITSLCFVTNKEIEAKKTQGSFLTDDRLVMTSACYEPNFSFSQT